MSTPYDLNSLTARCRVYLFTYQRPALLRRAVQSLLFQTYQNWVCEVHNDDPNDSRPFEVLRENPDPRISLITHPEKYGPTKTFNCAFVPIKEEFISILEDDNSWEPEFLATCITCLDQNPELALVWTNMQMWKQVNETTCVPTDVYFWPEVTKRGTKLPLQKVFRWPNSRSMMGGLYSNGAMVTRSKHAALSIIPGKCPFNFIESFRERAFPYPICLIRKKLANWTWTMSSARKDDNAQSLALRVLLVNSYLLHWKKTRFGCLRMWATARRPEQRQLKVIVLAILIKIRLWLLLSHLRFSDLFWLCVDFARAPWATLRSFAYMRRYAELRVFLNRKTEEQFKSVV